MGCGGGCGLSGLEVEFGGGSESRGKVVDDGAGAELLDELVDGFGAPAPSLAAGEMRLPEFAWSSGWVTVWDFWAMVGREKMPDTRT
jgi:hypothetical protein